MTRSFSIYLDLICFGAAMMVLMPRALYAAALAMHLPQTLAAPTAHLPLRFSDEPIWNWLLSLLVAIHLIGAMALLRGADLGRFGPRAAWLAGGSFSLYLVHYPVLQFLGATLPGAGLPRDAVILALTVLACLAFARMFERPLLFWRTMARRALNRSKTAQVPQKV